MVISFVGWAFLVLEYARLCVLVVHQNFLLFRAENFYIFIYDSFQLPTWPRKILWL